MIKQQLRTNGVLDEAILDLYETTPRHLFVPSSWENFAYSDLQIPLAHGERMMTPVEEGKLLQALALKGNETILEIGTGSGFLTALLSQLAKKVITLDYYPEFTQSAKCKLEKQGYQNIECITNDGSRGWFEKAPFDVVIFTSAMETMSKSLALQLSVGGKLVVVLGKAPVMSCQLHTLQAEDKWTVTELFETNLPFLIDKTVLKQFVF